MKFHPIVENFAKGVNNDACVAVSDAAISFRFRKFYTRYDVSTEACENVLHNELSLIASNSI